MSDTITIKEKEGARIGPAGLEERLAELTLQCEKYRAVFSQVNEAMFLAEMYPDEPGRAMAFVDVNDTACAWLGYTSEELRSMPPQNLIAPGDLPLVEVYRQTLAAGNWITVELGFLAKSGRVMPVEMSARVFHLDGKRLGLYVARDLSRVEALRRALAESAERWRSMTDNCPDYMLIVGLDGTIEFVNRSIFNFKREDMVGMNLFDQIPVSYRNFAESCVKKVFEDGKNQFHEIEFIRPLGRGVVIFIHINPIMIGGEITSVAARLVDVTDRKTMERTLMENESRYRNFVESFIGIAYEIDPAVEKPLFFRGAVEAITGYTEDDFMSGRIKWENLVHPMDRAARSSPFSGTNGREMEYRIINRNGKSVHVVESVKAMPGAVGAGSMIFGVIYDITERKTRQDLIIKRERELGETNASLTEMNTTLGILLKKRETDRTDMERNVSDNLARIIMPLLAKLKSSGLSAVQQSYLDAMESELGQVVSGFGRTLSSQKFRLTPTEVQVAALVKDGHPTKDIARMLNMSKSTVDTHRNNIRNKLEIKKQGVNLREYLATLE